MNKVTTIAVVIAKRVFSLYWVDIETGEVGAKAMTRAKFEEFMHTREPSRVVLEAGGSAHYWGRWLVRQGHEVRLIAPQHVRPPLCARTRPTGPMRVRSGKPRSAPR